MNPWNAVIDRISRPEERFRAILELVDGRIGARANRGRVLPDDRVDALIYGLSHANPAVRRCCLELLDQHPSPRAIPHIAALLDDPVPRVRWHAVHALICDVCKDGSSYLTGELLERVRDMAQSDPSEKVRSQAQWGLERAGAVPT